MAAGSPTAALEPRGRQARSKPCLSGVQGLIQSRPPAFPAKMSKLWASTTASGVIVHDYQSPPMVNAELPAENLAAGKVGSSGGWGRTGAAALFAGEIHLAQVARCVDDLVDQH